jgi:hypothetical protein
LAFTSADHHAKPNGQKRQVDSLQANGQSNRVKDTSEQIKRLQEEKPSITADATRDEDTLNAAHGSQWIALLTTAGEFQVCTLSP